MSLIEEGLWILEGTRKDRLPCPSGGSDSKASAYNVGDQGSVPGSGSSPGGGNGNNPIILEEPGRLQSLGSQRVGHD